jgi:hypothetical protein
MTIEEARSLMLTLDELREIYEQVKRTGEPQRLYLLEGDYEGGIEVHITPNGTWLYGSESEGEENTPDVLENLISDYEERFYARYGPCYHGLPFLGWACFRSREDAEVWEAATLGHCKEEAV